MKAEELVVALNLLLLECQNSLAQMQCGQDLLWEIFIFLSSEKCSANFELHTK